MKRLSVLLACSLSFFFTSCNLFNKSDKWYEKTQTEFDSERQLILYKDVSNYDLKVELTYAVFNDKIKQMNEINSLFGAEQEDLSDINYQFSFYNYGGSIKLCNAYIDDAFIQDFTDILHIQVIKPSDVISIRNTYNDEKYGDYGIANINDGQNIINDVFVTPLSLKAINHEEKSGFILVVFYAEEIQKAMKVLFYTDRVICDLAEKYPSKILENTITGGLNLKSLKNGPGRFWFDVNP